VGCGGGGRQKKVGECNLTNANRHAGKRGEREKERGETGNTSLEEVVKIQRKKNRNEDGTSNVK